MGKKNGSPTRKEEIAMEMKSKKMPKIIFTILMVIIGLGSVFPFIFMILSTFKIESEVLQASFKLWPSQWILDNIQALFVSDYYDFMQWYRNTIIMTGTSLLLKFFFVSYTAYGFSKIQFKGRDVIFMVLLAALMIPSDIMILPRYIIFKRIGILNTMWSIILPSLVDVYFVFLLRQAFISIPESLSEAARIDGCGHFRIYFKIIMPLAKPAVATMMLFSFVWIWNDYMSPYLYISDVKKQMLSVGIQLFATGQVLNYGVLMAGATLVLLPVILIFIFAQNYFVEGVATSGVKG